MANEFVARNGVIALSNSQITGSLTVTDSITGSLFGTASFATNALTASYAGNVPETSSFSVTASYAISASQAINSNNASTASYVNQLNQNVSISGSVNVSQSINVPVVNTPLVQNGSQYIAQDTNTSITAIQNGSYAWRFYPGGTLQPAGAIVGSTFDATSVDVTQNVLLLKSLYYGAQIITAPDGVTTKTWSFKTDGDLEIPTGRYITGSLLGTASYATQALNTNTASYVNQLNQNVSISGSVNISQSISTPLINIKSGSLNEGIIDINNSINSWIYSGKSFSIGGQETAPVGVFFKSDGTKMYVNGSSGDDINEYNLGTPWDVTTAVFSTLFSTAGQDTAAGDLFFSSDGTRLYITGDANNTIFQYSLGTAWDISTATYSSISFSVAAKDTNPSGIWFKSDGTKMYVCGFSSDSVHEYDLGTAWNVSTATFLQSFSVSSQETVPASINFNNDGTKFYIVGSTNDNIYEYNLGTPWNISTAVYYGRSYVGNQEVTPTGLYITTDNVYVVGSTNDTVYQYYSNTNALRLTSDSLVLNTALVSTTGSVSINQNLDVFGNTNLVGATTAGSVTTSTLTVNGTLSSTSTTTLASSTAAQTVALGAGATLAATTKTINIGTSGVATSITNVNIGSAVAGALGTIILNHNTLITGSLNVSQGITGSLFGTASFATISNTSNTASFVTTAQTASYVLNAVSASYALNASTATSATTATSASYAATASYADNFTVKGTLTAQTLNVQTVSSSVVYSSGSNVFGNTLSNTQTFTGSVNITGSLNLVGNQISSGSLTLFGPNNNTPNIRTQNSSLILEGNAGLFSSFGSQLRITANQGAWTDNVTSSYFQIKTTGSFGSNNYVTFQGGTWASDAPFDRLQFASYYTSFNNGAYGTTPVPTASVEVINSNTGTIPLLQLKTLVGQTSNYVNITSGSTAGNVFNITKDGVVAIGTTNTSTEANLFLGAKGTDEGGQLFLQKGTSQNSASMLDNYQDQFRVLTGTDTTSNRSDLILSHVTRNLTVYGDVIAYGSSDKRLKENIQPIENALDKLDKIGGYTFDWDDKIAIHGHEGHDIGVIAQEIEEVLPEVVTTRDNGYKAVKYEKIVPFLIQCIKELKDEIRDLKSQK
jgi:hypothetical protein